MAREYYNALIHCDWVGAYALLHPDVRARLRPEEYCRRADVYRRGIGFEPDTVHVQACEEQGDEAIAHLVLTAGTVSQQQRHKDATALRRVEGSWRVLVPVKFGLGRGI